MYEFASRATQAGIGVRLTANELNFDKMAAIKEDEDESSDDQFADLFA